MWRGKVCLGGEESTSIKVGRGLIRGKESARCGDVIYSVVGSGLHRTRPSPLPPSLTPQGRDVSTPRRRTLMEVMVGCVFAFSSSRDVIDGKGFCGMAIPHVALSRSALLHLLGSFFPSPFISRFVCVVRLK